MIKRLLQRFADPRLQQENTELRSQIRVLELEQEKLLDVIERDRRRVAAEIAIHARRQADAEEKPQSPNYAL